jgi:hypothetical protein
MSRSPICSTKRCSGSFVELLWHQARVLKLGDIGHDHDAADREETCCHDPAAKVRREQPTDGTEQCDE